MGETGFALVDVFADEPGTRVVVAQGHAMGRPARIEVTLDAAGPVIAGRAVLTAAGSLRLP